MKKNLFFAFVAMAVLACSCSTVMDTTKEKESYVRAIKYTSIDKLCQVQPGNSYDVVVQTLGCEPYNLLSNQKDGYAIYLYKYKLVERDVKADIADDMLNQRGGETSGIEVYNPKIEDAYLVFKDNKLESIVTSYGQDKAMPFILLNNTLYKITKDSDTYTIHAEMHITPPAANDIKEEKPASGPAMAIPFMKKH